MTMEKNPLLLRLKAYALKKRTYSLWMVPLMTAFAFTSVVQATPKLEVYNSTTVFDATTAVTNGSSVDILLTGTTTIPTNISKTFTIQNKGTDPIIISSINLVQDASTIPPANLDTVVGAGAPLEGITGSGTVNPKFSQPALTSTNIPGGGSATFSVLFDTGATTIATLPNITNPLAFLTFTGTVQIISNDGGTTGSLFKIPVKGIIGTAAADVRILDEKGNEVLFCITAPCSTTVTAPNPQYNGIIDFGSISLGGTAVSKTFKLMNIGTGAATLTPTTGIKIAGDAPTTDNILLVTGLTSPLPSSAFAVSPYTISSLAVGATTPFTVTFNSTSAGVFGALIEMESSAHNANMLTGSNIPFPATSTTASTIPAYLSTATVAPPAGFTNTLAGQFGVVGRVTALPIMEVVEGTTPTAPVVADNTGVADFGVLLINDKTNNIKTFTVRNASTAPATTESQLILDNPINLTGTGFSLTHAGAPNLPTTTLASSDGGALNSTNFTVTFDTSVAGTFEGEISIGNNDATKKPYNFKIKGVVVENLAQEIQVFDGKPADVQAGTAKEIFDGQADPVVFEALIGATPLPVKTFSVRNAGKTVLKLNNLSPRPKGLTLLGAFPDQVNPGEIASFDIQLDSTEKNTFDGVMEIFNNDSDENPFNFPIVIKVREPAPEIQVMDGTKEIVDGTTTPIDFGATLVGKSVPRIFTINNIGEMDLTLIAPSKPDGFSVVDFPAIVRAKETASFTVRLDANIAGEYKGEISFGNNDLNENPFNFAITGKVDKTIPNNQEIDVWDGNKQEVAAGTAIAIPNNSPTPVSFGQTPVGTPVPQTFTIENAGLTQLRLFGLQLPSGFSLEGGQVSFAPIPAQDSTEFTVKLNAIKEGIYSGQLILFNDDDNETPYIFQLSGIVGNPPEAFPELQVMDGETEIANNTGIANLGTTIVGTKVTKTFTINNVGGVDLNLTSDVVFSGTGFTVTSFTSPLTIASGASTTFKVALDANSEGAFNGTLSFDNNDPDEAKFSFAITGTVGGVTPPATPEIQVVCFPPSPPVEIIDNTGKLDFGETVIGTPMTKTCEVNNIGNADLTLTSDVTFAGSGFTVSSFTSPVKITSGGKVSFQVTLDATTAGNFSGSLSFENDDSDENPFNFAISGVVIEGGTIPPITSGLQVSCGTTEIVDGSTTPIDFGTTKVGQPLTKTCTVKNALTDALDLYGYPAFSPNEGFSIVGIYPDRVTGKSEFTFEIQLNTSVEGTFCSTVKLFHSADPKNPFDFGICGTVVKDSSTSMEPEIQVLDGTTDIIDGATTSTDFGVTGVGDPVTRTFTVKNVGKANLNLTSAAILASGNGFTVESFLVPTTLAPEETTTFKVTLTAAIEGQFVGEVSFGNNDNDENPFNFPVSGAVTQINAHEKACFEQGGISTNGKNCLPIPESTAGTNTDPSNTKIKGGISKSEGGQYTPFQITDTVSVAMPVITAGVLKIDSSDIGKPAGIIAAGLYKSSVFPKGFEWYTLVTCSTCPTGWRVDVLAYDETTIIPLLTRENLSPFDNVDKLPAYYTVPLYEGLLPYSGEIDIYFGYRVDEGDGVKVVYSQTPIHATINNP